MIMSNIYKHRLSLEHYYSKSHPFCLANVQKEEKEEPPIEWKTLCLTKNTQRIQWNASNTEAHHAN